MWLVAAFQAILQANRAMQAFAQCGALVLYELPGLGGRGWAAEVNAIGWGDRLYAGHGGMEGALVGVGMRRARDLAGLPVGRQVRSMASDLFRYLVFPIRQRGDA